GSGGSAAGGSGGSGGGVGGAGGGTPPPPECKSDEDCALFSDCCNCVAYPVGGEAPPGCDAACAEAQCFRDGVQAAACRFGRCTTARNCDLTTASCESLPPACPTGRVATVTGACWGPCVAPSECDAVETCEACAAGEVCVTVTGGVGSTAHCVRVPEACAADRSCACMGRSVCGGSCQDWGGHLECGCPLCP
ncbi:MAG: hypothetical protein IT376_02250, partial [Polyangiaceae bacterium]|nr:hypothetical protein [Polyangiaceae bacterium]